MKKDKNKSNQIYGDNDQVKYDQLMAKEEEINKLVDIVTDKTLKKRATTFKKQKKVKDTSMNMGKRDKNKPLEDMDKEVFDMSGNGATDAVQIAENTTQKKSKKKKEKEDKPKKKGGLKIFIWIIVILFVLSGGYIGYRYLETNGYFNKNTNEPIVENVPPTTTEGSVETMESTYQPVSVEGKLIKMDLTKEYTVEDTLNLANEFNNTLINYYNTFIEEAKNADYDVDIVAQAARNMIPMVQEDVIALSDYMNVFFNLKGDYYINTAIRRYDNLNQMLSDLLGKADKYEVQETMNQFIQEENYLSGDSKNALIEFLSENGVQYEDSGEYITFDLVDVEQPVETEEPVETESLEPTATPEVINNETDTTNTEAPTE